MESPGLRFYDSHNHLQDSRLKPHWEQVVTQLQRWPIAKMVVNGSCERDWPDVLELARCIPQVLPSFGYHPWYIAERTKNWREMLMQFLGAVASGIGEIGLDRWIENYDWEAQQEVFTAQMQIAAERNLPVSIHCLQAWGKLLELLQNGPRPARGFLLHSYGGPVEMIQGLAELGAYFSVPGYFAHKRKLKQRETFREVPWERLLIETDAPDQLPPEERVKQHLTDAEGKSINHPGNILAVYEFAAELRGATTESLAMQVEQNFFQLFGGVVGGSTKPSHPPTATEAAEQGPRATHDA